MPDFKLNGANPLSYEGVRASTPPQMIVKRRAPTSQDYIGFPLGTQWLHYNVDTPATSIQYVLTSVSRNTAVWVPLNGNSDNPTLPNHSVVLGIGTPGFNSTGPIATLGAPLISNGTSADPSFGVASVSGGGTGLNVCTPYSVYCGGNVGDGPLQQVSGLGTAGQILTSNGNGSLPTWQSSTGGSTGGPIGTQVFTSSGTYVPTAGMGSCIVECVGGGGGGGSIAASIGGAGGGGAGGYTRKVFTATDIGASQAVTIGAGGAATVNGGNTLFGPFLTANGGVAGGSGINGIGGLGGSSTGGSINLQGGAGGSGCAAVNAALNPSGLAGFGGSNLYGSGGLGYPNAATDSVGQPGNVYGGGGSGAVRQTAGTSAGGAGASGVIIVTEYGPYGILPPIASTTVNFYVLDTPGAGTYTPTSGMRQVIVECIGGGGGAGGIFSGGSGGYTKRLYSSVEIGASKPYSVGSGGSGSVFPPTVGGNTTFGTGGTLMTAGGGQIQVSVPGNSFLAAAGGSATGGQLNIPGGSGGINTNATLAGSDGSNYSGAGGSNLYGSGGGSVLGNTQYPPVYGGQNGTGYGSGGSSQARTNSSLTNGNGASGAIIITEYIS